MLICSSFALAHAAPPFRSVTALEKGVHGIGKTVVSGVEIEEFGVEVLGIVAGAGPSGALILIRTYGPLIERTGGIAAGMSGSPVYVDGSLIGAISHGFFMADHTIGLITPIDDMITVRALLAKTKKDETKVLPDIAVLSGEPVNALHDLLPADVAVALPVATPLIASGLGRRTREVLETALGDWGMFSVPGGRSQGQLPVESEKIEPGSAIGVQLISGDVDLTALGTVTYVDDKSFIAFGHPMMNIGEVDFFATSAYVHEVVASVEVPFKIASPGANIGRITQDRQAGVAGWLGETPQSIDVHVEVYDASTEKVTRLNVQIADDENLTVPLLAIALLEAFDRAIDRIGAGTATVSATIDVFDLAESLRRDNLFYSASDISAVSLAELLTGLQKLLGNEFAAIELKSINIRADIEMERRTARIESARVKKKRIFAGETVEIEVTLRPFREELISRTLSLQIPSYASPGEVTIFVRAGGYGLSRMIAWDLAGQLGEYGLELGESEEDDNSTTAANLERFLDTLFDNERNYEIIAEFYPLPLDEEIDEEGNMPAFDEHDGRFDPVKGRSMAPYVIQGAATVSLEILPEPSNDEEDENSTEDEG